MSISAILILIVIIIGISASLIGKAIDRTEVRLIEISNSIHALRAFLEKNASKNQGLMREIQVLLKLLDKR